MIGSLSPCWATSSIPSLKYPPLNSKTHLPTASPSTPCHPQICWENASQYTFDLETNLRKKLILSAVKVNMVTLLLLLPGLVLTDRRGESDLSNKCQENKVSTVHEQQSMWIFWRIDSYSSSGYSLDRGRGNPPDCIQLHLYVLIPFLEGSPEREELCYSSIVCRC